MNVYRTRRGVDPGEYQALSPTLGSYHQPGRAAELIFGKEIAPKNIFKYGGFEKRKHADLLKRLRMHNSKGKATVEVVTKGALEGKQCLRIVVPKEGEYASINAYVGAAAGRTYKLTLKFRSKNVGTWKRGKTTPVTRIMCKDRRGKSVTPTKQYSWRSADATKGLDGWAEHSHLFVTAPKTEKITATMFFQCPGEYLLDDVRIVEQAD